VARVRVVLASAFGFGVSLAVALAVPVALATRLGQVDAGRARPAPGSRTLNPVNRPPLVTAGPGFRIVLGEHDTRPSARARVREDSLELAGQSGRRIMGLRFAALGIPRNATVLSAHIQFQAGEASTWTGPLSIRGRGVDDAPGFTEATRGESLRPFTVAGVDWLPLAGPRTRGFADGWRTPDLSAVIQEIVGRPGWAPGNALVLVFSGTGTVPDPTAEDGGLEKPLLQIAYRQRPEA